MSGGQIVSEMIINWTAKKKRKAHTSYYGVQGLLDVHYRVVVLFVVRDQENESIEHNNF